MDGAELKASQAHFLLLAKNTSAPNPRLGFIVAKKKVRRAVDRNRIKRCVRENFRKMKHELPAIDIVFLARHDVGRLDSASLHLACQEGFRRLARKAKHEPTSSRQTK